MTIRPGTREDLAAIAAIQDQSSEASHWNPEEYLGYNLRVAEDEGVISGFLVTRQVAGGEYEILNVAVRHDRRRTGAGAALIRAVLAASPGEYFLEVRASNEVARRFYRALGFEEVGRRRNYYTQPDEPAIVMRIRS